MARTRARPLEAEDAELVFALMNDLVPPCRPSSCVPETPISIERVRAWIGTVNVLQTEMHFVLSKKKGGSFGLASVTDVDLSNRSARLAILMSDGDLRRGYGAEAVKGVLDLLCNWYNMHRVWAMIGEESEQMLSAFSESGFEQEGVLRDDHYSGGTWRSSLLMSAIDVGREGASDD